MARAARSHPDFPALRAAPPTGGHASRSTIDRPPAARRAITCAPRLARRGPAAARPPRRALSSRRVLGAALLVLLLRLALPLSAAAAARPPPPPTVGCRLRAAVCQPLPPPAEALARAEVAGAAGLPPGRSAPHISHSASDAWLRKVHRLHSHSEVRPPPPPPPPGALVLLPSLSALRETLCDPAADADLGAVGAR